MDTRQVRVAAAAHSTNIDDITAIDLLQVSCCFSEDEEIVEWETLIANGLDNEKVDKRGAT